MQEYQLQLPQLSDRVRAYRGENNELKIKTDCKVDRVETFVRAFPPLFLGARGSLWIFLGAVTEITEEQARDRAIAVFSLAEV